MEINILAIVVIIVLAGLAWYCNEKLNSIPVLKNVVSVIIVVVSVLMLLQSTGLISGNSSIRIS